MVKVKQVLSGERHRYFGTAHGRQVHTTPRSYSRLLSEAWATMMALIVMHSDGSKRPRTCIAHIFNHVYDRYIWEPPRTCIA